MAPSGRERDDLARGMARRISDSCCFGLWLNGRTLDEVNAIGEPIQDDTFLVLFNSHHAPMRFTLPQPRPGTSWELCLDTRTQPPRPSAACPHASIIS